MLKQSVHAFCITVSALMLVASEPVWNRPPASWSKDDAQVILTSSPWSRMIKAAVIDLGSESARRDGGMMGRARGIGYDGLTPKHTLFGTRAASPSAAANPAFIPLLVRWESALPIRVAKLKASQPGVPLSSDEGNSIAIYGIPGTYFGEPRRFTKQLTAAAALEQDAHQPIKPSYAEAYQMPDGIAIVYYFPALPGLSENGSNIRFSTRIGRIQLSETFALRDLRFDGKLPLLTAGE